MNRANVTPTQALSRLLAAAKQINADECKDERVFHALQGEIAVAEGMLRDYVEPEPYAYASARSLSVNQQLDSAVRSIMIAGHPFKSYTVPIFTTPVAAQSAVAAASVDDVLNEMQPGGALYQPPSAITEQKIIQIAASMPISPWGIGSRRRDAIAFAWEVLKAAPLYEAGNAAATAHSDDIAVDRFAVSMKQKMAASRAKGRGGWDNPAECLVQDLAIMLVDHLEKGDPVDIGNFCMMIWNRMQSGYALGEFDIITAAINHRPAAAPSIAAPTEVEREAGLDALKALVDHLADGDVEGLIEHSEPMISARKALAGYNPVAQCTNSDSWNCKYCRISNCEALKDSRNFGKPISVIDAAIATGEKHD